MPLTFISSSIFLKPLLFGPMLDDPLCRLRSNARQCRDLSGGGGVQVERRGRRRAPLLSGLADFSCAVSDTDKQQTDTESPRTHVSRRIRCLHLDG